MAKRKAFSLCDDCGSPFACTGRRYCALDNSVPVANRAITAKPKHDAHAELLRIATELRDAFHWNPGHSDLDNEQPIHISTTLGTWRRLNIALTVINAEKK